MFLKRKGNRTTIDIIKQVDSFPFNFHLIGPIRNLGLRVVCWFRLSITNQHPPSIPI